MLKEKSRINRKMQKNKIKQKTTALILLDTLINEESDVDKLVKLKTIRKEMKKLCVTE